MPADSLSDAQLELAHVLFIDIVGYSKRLINEQTMLVSRLNELVLQTEQCRKADAAGKLIRIPTGDGMALAFFTSPDAPVRCAMELSKADQADPKLELRMGIHTGPVDQVSDVNQRSNVTGAGINMAQRVMDCGDAGHILLSKHIAEDLEQYGHWQPLLHDLGECEVKHGGRLGVVNLYSDEVGNPKTPRKLQAVQQHRARTRWAAIVTALLLLSGSVAALIIFSRKTATSRLAVPEKSIAVLPFENLSDDKSNAYFAEGIQDEILTKLASIADLKVISRTSTAKYKSKPEDLKIVSQQLGVANVVEGTVQRAAEKVRVNVQLVDARADSHLWAKTYDRDIKDVFAVEIEVSQEIADALQAKLSPNEANTLATAPTRDAEAYDLFLKGEYEERDAESSLKPEPFDRAAVFYKQALTHDPNFALAAARLADSRIYRHWFVTRFNETELAEVKKMADHALALDPNLAEAHVAVGNFYYYGKRQYDEALNEFRRALELRPNNAQALESIAFIHRRQGQWERLLPELAKCEERDPRNALLIANLGTSYLNLRMWQEAKRAGLRALALDPHNVVGMRAVFISDLNGSNDINEAKRAWATFPPGTTLSNPSQVGNAATIIGDGTYLNIIARDFAAAFKAWENETADPDQNRSRLAARVAIHVLAGDAASAQGEIASARELVEARLRVRPDDIQALIQLSWIDLALKSDSEALRFAHQAAELLPVEKDAMGGPPILAGLAEIQARVGESDEAVKTLRRLLSIPAGVCTSLQRLKIDPVWDPIRNHPGFQQLLAGKEQIGPNK
jgi:TolB-like protein/class 3 adenylate cyclase/Flp pilus assembly protein TadD